MMPSSRIVHLQTRNLLAARRPLPVTRAQPSAIIDRSYRMIYLSHIKKASVINGSCAQKRCDPQAHDFDQAHFFFYLRQRYDTWGRTYIICDIFTQCHTRSRTWGHHEAWKWTTCRAGWLVMGTRTRLWHDFPISKNLIGFNSLKPVLMWPVLGTEGVGAIDTIQIVGTGPWR